MRPPSRGALRIALAGAATLVALGVAETFVTLTDADWRRVSDQLYYQAAEPANHVADPDPELLYRLRPLATSSFTDIYGHYTAQVNEHGYRGASRSVDKPEGTYRIAVLGGSNVYGAGVDDSQTWPARLEVHLSAHVPGTPFEVWNLGVSGYTGSQMAALGREFCERFDPDLMIIAPSNMGTRPVLVDEHPRPLLRDSPDCWRYLLGVEGELGWLRRFALTHVRSYRLAELVAADRRGNPEVPLWARSAEIFEAENLSSIQALVADHGDQVRMCLFILPAARPRNSLGFSEAQLDDPLFKYGPIPDYVPQLELLQRYGEGLDSYYLDATGHPAEYSRIHPPARVLDWYGENVARWLVERELVPTRP